MAVLGYIKNTYTTFESLPQKSVFALEVKTDNTSLHFCEKTRSFEPEHVRRHRTKKHSGEGLHVIHTVDTHFRRAVDYRTYRLVNCQSMIIRFRRTSAKWRYALRRLRSRTRSMPQIRFKLLDSCVVSGWSVIPTEFLNVQRCGSLTFL